MFKIPKSFNLLGRTITVEHKQEILHTDWFKGRACYPDDKIQLAPRDSKGDKRTQQDLELCFLHEVSHWFFYMFANDGNSKLHADEMMVDRFAGGMREVMGQLKFDRKAGKKRG